MEAPGDRYLVDPVGIAVYSGGRRGAPGDRHLVDPVWIAVYSNCHLKMRVPVSPVSPVK